MELIEKDLPLYNLLKSEIHIVDGKITSIHIYLLNDLLTIDVDIRLLLGKGAALKLRFTDVKEYSFNHNEFYNFYNIEDYKLIQQDDLYYISFDPDTGLEDASPIDGDIIVCRSIDGYYI
jgi:hypothetical protein